MPLYQYKCSTCHDTFERFFAPNAEGKQALDAGIVGCGACPSGVLRRVFSFVIGPRFEPHFNESQGAWVNSFREVKDNAKRASDLATARTGVAHNFVPMDINEMKPSDDVGLAATHDRQVALGLKDPAPRAF